MSWMTRGVSHDNIFILRHEIHGFVHFNKGVSVILDGQLIFSGLNQFD